MGKTREVGNGLRIENGIPFYWEPENGLWACRDQREVLVRPGAYKHEWQVIVPSIGYLREVAGEDAEDRAFSLGVKFATETM